MEKKNFNEANSLQDEDFVAAIEVEKYLENNPCNHTKSGVACKNCIRNAVEAVENRQKN